MIKALFIILFGLLSIESIDEYEKAKKHNNSKDPNLIFALSVMKPFAIFACFVLFLEFIS